ncbi:hypothetical protein DTO164E3_8306 [Paecilomyces variotii]|nr:hypothetical protein DTO164E3_8306 [Paecilomyces variotii]KAJ9200403.1 hypothetical protein DTO032I3_4709 [Paecilomyces variotii]KAJ9225117.1 hypothetical protein DTO169C6_2458 [Paecilomyces variotii]KAJ9247588.1 hypothetical protein DTO195F2_9101 [Paecilomyces variotii]KAJ9274968.1 hypothetical protein DTO021D3_8139 [Paecilomyces variotii]
MMLDTDATVITACANNIVVVRDGSICAVLRYLNIRWYLRDTGQSVYVVSKEKERLHSSHKPASPNYSQDFIYSRPRVQALATNACREIPSESVDYSLL